MNLFYRHKGNHTNPKLMPLTLQQCFYMSTLRIRDTPVDRFDMPAAQFLKEILKMSYFTSPLDSSNHSSESLMNVETLEMVYALTFGGDVDFKVPGPFNEMSKSDFEESMVKIANEFHKAIDTHELLNGKFLLVYYMNIAPGDVDNMPYFEFCHYIEEIQKLLGKGKKGS